MKILFIGCVESSYKLLKALIESEADVCGVITMEHSDFNSDFVDLSPLCEEHSILVCKVRNVNDPDSVDFIKQTMPDIGFCFGWSQLIKEEVINLFPKGVVGFHPAALPNNRGRHPLIWALALGLKETASSFFMITASADEGDIVSQQFVSIDYEDDARTLYDKIMAVAIKQEVQLVKELEDGIVQKIPQKSEDGNSWRKRGRLDGEIDWRMPSSGIYNLVRALTKPYCGAHFVHDGQEYKVWKVKEEAVEGCDNIEPGKVLSIDNGIVVKAGIGAIRILEFDCDVKMFEGMYI